MEIPNTYSVPGVPVSEQFAAAFAAGCRGPIVTDGMLCDGPFAFFALPSLLGIMKQARSEGRDWYYGDHGYFRRDSYYRVTRNAFQHCGIEHRSSYASPATAAIVGRQRLEALGVKLEPWRAGGRFILLCPPSSRYTERQGFATDLWVDNIKRRLRQYTTRKIKVRPRDFCEEGSTLREALEGCWAVVVHQSNVAVESLCMGYPVFTTGYCAGRAMAETDLSQIESPFMCPDGREQWAAVLASNQWTLEEMASGAAWKHLHRGES